MSTYLDYNATSPLRPQAWEAMNDAREWWCNPSSVHHLGRFARGHLEKIRRRFATFLDAPSAQLTFTSGGSEANNTVLKGLAPRVKAIVASSIEHESVQRAVPHETLAVDEQGCVRLGHLEELLKKLPKPVLVSVMLANNETGTLQPLEEIVALAKRHEALVHTDAVQALGKIPVSFQKLGVDVMTLSAHKIGGPVGIGVIVSQSALEIPPLIQGGGQENGRRAGTENILGIVGFEAAFEASLQDDMNRIKIWRDRLEARALGLVPDVHIPSFKVERLPNTSSLIVPGFSFEKQMMMLDLEGVCVSAGSACTSSKMRPSHVLLTMGVPEEMARCAIRVSLGWRTTEADIERFCAVWTRVVNPKAGEEKPHPRVEVRGYA